MDDLTGEELEPVLVKSARQENMAYIHHKNVWTVMKRDEAHREGMGDNTNTLDRHQQRRCGKAWPRSSTTVWQMDCLLQPRLSRVSECSSATQPR